MCLHVSVCVFSRLQFDVDALLYIHISFKFSIMYCTKSVCLFLILFIVRLVVFPIQLCILFNYNKSFGFICRSLVYLKNFKHFSAHHHIFIWPTAHSQIKQIKIIKTLFFLNETLSG